MILWPNECGVVEAVCLFSYSHQLNPSTSLIVAFRNIIFVWLVGSGFEMFCLDHCIFELDVENCLESLQGFAHFVWCHDLWVWFCFIDVKGNNLHDIYVCTCLSFWGNVINSGAFKAQELFSATLNTVGLFVSSTWPSHLVYHFWVQPTWPTSVTRISCPFVGSFPWASPWLSFPV